MVNQNKKRIVTSAISVALCGALLASSSFAWFTDKVTSTNNTIAAGELDLEVAVIDVTKVLTDGDYVGAYSTLDEDGKYTYNNLENGDKLIIDSSNWEPGQSDAKLIQLHNNGTLAMEVAINVVSEGDLTDALWFSLYTYTDVDTDDDGGEDAAVLDETVAYKVSASELAAVLAAQEIVLKADAATSGSEEFTVAAATTGYILEYGMYEEAGNEYQETTFTASFEFLAKQATVETDGFGSDQYDANATYNNGGWVSIPSDVAADLAAATTTTEKATILAEAGIITSASASATYVNMIADGEFNLESGIVLSQGSTVTVNMLSGYEDGATITMTAQEGTSNSGISMSADGYLTIGTSNSSGVLTYDVEVKDADGNVIDSYVATFMSINFSGPDAYNTANITVSNDQTIALFNGNNGKQITQYSAIKDEIVSITVTSGDESYVTIDSWTLTENESADTGNISVTFDVLKTIDTTVRVYLTVELSDGSTHTTNVKLAEKNMAS